MTPKVASDESTYTVRRWSGLVRLGSEAGSVVLLGVGLGLFQGQWVACGIAGIVALALVAIGADRATLAFRVDAGGITWARPGSRSVLLSPSVRKLDWDSVRDLEVVEGELVRARLRADAPLPNFMTGRVVGPYDPGAGALVEGSVPGVEGARVENVMVRVAPEVSIRRLMGRTADGS